MTSRQFIILGTAALIVTMGAIWIGLSNKPRVAQSAALYPALQGQLIKVRSLQIYQPGDQLSVELAHIDTGWAVKQRNGYAGDAQKINALLLSLEGAKVREEKTSNPDNYAVLGVQDLSTPGATGARVELNGIDPPVKLIVGKSDAAARATFVRRAGEPKSWLVSEQLSAPTDVTSWLSHDLLNIGADRIQEVIVELQGSPRYSVIKATRAAANFDVAPLPKQRELNSVGAANGVAQALVNLQLDDVRPGDVANAKSTAQASFRTFDGLVVTISGYSLDEKQWITVKASVDEALAKRFHPATDKTDSLETALKKSRDEADALNKQRNDWAYAIAAYKYDAIFKPVEQLLKKNDPIVKKK